MTNNNLSSNPLLNTSNLPVFSRFQVQHIMPAINKVLADNRAVINELSDSLEIPNWKNFVQPIEAIDNQLERVWGPVGHIDVVKNSDEWHDAYTNCLDKVTQYHAEVGQNSELYKKFKAIHESDAFTKYSDAQKKSLKMLLETLD